MTFGDFAQVWEDIGHNKLKFDFEFLGKKQSEYRKMDFIVRCFRFIYNDLPITEEVLKGMPGVGVKRLELIYETAEYLGFKVDTYNKDVIISYS